MRIKASIKDLTVADLRWEIKTLESIDCPSFTVRNRIKSLRKHLECKESSEWRREHAGRYVSLLSGWIIERSENARVWNIVNPATAQVFDTAKLLRIAKLTYSNIKLNA